MHLKSIHGVAYLNSDLSFVCQDEYGPSSFPNLIEILYSLLRFSLYPTVKVFIATPFHPSPKTLNALQYNVQLFCSYERLMEIAVFLG
jgi:hypothetical protein